MYTLLISSSYMPLGRSIMRKNSSWGMLLGGTQLSVRAVIIVPT
jgi:hypothetical protein